MKKVTTNSLWGMFCVRSLMLMAILGFSLVGSDAYAKGTGTKDDPFIFEDGGSYSLDGLICTVCSARRRDNRWR